MYNLFTQKLKWQNDLVMKRHIKDLIQLFERELFLIIIDEEE
jgi:hypothetical protein